MSHPVAGVQITNEPTKKNQYHMARLSHAGARMLFELMELHDQKVDAIIERYSACIITGPRVAMEYPQDGLKLYEAELAAIREAEAAEQSVKFASPESIIGGKCADPRCGCNRNDQANP